MYCALVRNLLFTLLAVHFHDNVSHCKAISCTATKNDTSLDGSVSGTIRSPNFPLQYPKNLQCTWRITVPESKRVRLVIKNMTFGAGDYILFRDGIQDDSPQIAKYAHCAYGTLRLYSTGRYMLVNFVSDASSLGTGFQLDFESLDSSGINCSSRTDTCSATQTVHNTTGFLRSLGFPKSLPGNNSECRWRIEMPSGYRVLLDFLWFATADKGNINYCADDAVAISADSLRQSYCGCQPPPRILSRTVEIRFSNYEASNHAGLLAYYRSVEIPSEELRYEVKLGNIEITVFGKGLESDCFVLEAKIEGSSSHCRCMSVGAEECQQGGANACPMNLHRGLGTNRNRDICYEVAVSSTSSSSSPTTESTLATQITSHPTTLPTTDGNPRSGASLSHLNIVWIPPFLSIILVLLCNLWSRV